ncbi:hypothetical protein [Pseudonocardia endophytica]|uniref:Polyketide cyclase/dehydrase/lipid transport protein n=1 Tax=Pseudonocardia endophytica TaxID=401976 RepID=A0A4V2PI13_PSEEN|nr:hypothetical protein [Pseudonocardia endophytica]TCK22806.1 hypothetical protein EV378_6817 [Pseudonocardia endophytica]
MILTGAGVDATVPEIWSARPGDGIVEPADVVMDRGFDVRAALEAVWPWLVQLGKGRAGWYLPRRLERLLPHGNRAARLIDPRWQALAVGDVIPDYGGRDETFTVASIDPPSSLVYRSTRGRMGVSWAITLRPSGSGSRVHLRLRLGPVRRRWLATTVGELFDALTIAGMAAGLAERVAQPSDAARRNAR